jgi:predicted lysophospholipase L1 biosynthesis ABC-type transport system permease subunit
LAIDNSHLFLSISKKYFVGSKKTITLYFKVLYMDSKNYHEDLSHIRSMMERSSRFISLSGLSGVFAGLAAIIGAVYVYFVFQREGIDYFDSENHNYTSSLVNELVLIGTLILLTAIFSGYIFTANKSKKKGLKIWDSTTKRLLTTFAVPLVAGGVFCLGLLYHHLFVLIAPATLIFYGIALVGAERYTLTDIKYLGWGLLFWAFGFGILHIVYGLIMHIKYK